MNANESDGVKFGSGEPFSLGVEEELLVVGRGNRLADDGERVISEAEPTDGAVEREVFKAMVETNSTVCADAREAALSLQGLRRAIPPPFWSGLEGLALRGFQSFPKLR